MIHSVPSPSLPSVPILVLNCFIQGDDASQIFSVEIANTRLVSALKGTIKDKNTESFHNIDARSLHLWKVSIPVDDSFKENVINVELRDGEALSPVDRLLNVFSGQPQDGHLLIIVTCPPNSEYKYVVESDRSFILFFIP
jgi:hypothetical protein